MNVLIKLQSDTAFGVNIMDVLIVILIAIGLLFALAVGLFLLVCFCALLVSDYGWIIPVLCGLLLIIAYAYQIALDFNLI